MDFNEIPQLSKEELEANRSVFKANAVKSVRDSIEDQFTDNYDNFKRLIGSYNQLVGSYINRIENVDFNSALIMNYDSFCVDLLAMFDEYAKTEAKLDDLFVDPPFEIMMMMMSNDIEHQDTTQRYMHGMINSVIAVPFETNIHDRFLIHKLGPDNAKMIKDDHMAFMEKLVGNRDDLTGMLEALKALGQLTDRFQNSENNG